MKRAVVLATLLAFVGGAAGTASAGISTKTDNHNVCIVWSPDQTYTNTQYYCVSTPDLPPR